MIVSTFSIALAALSCVFYAMIPSSGFNRFWIAAIGGCVNVIVAVLVWFAIRLGSLSDAFFVLSMGPGEVWSTIVLFSRNIAFSLNGSELTGESLLYIFWVPELVLLFLFPVIMSRFGSGLSGLR
ncbi:hypothetical protein RIdsm_01605 [Roseovarius indicus]|nr:hypothetical protein RIdsm_01605 [Roseovarius indicus]SFD88822.1 hypothetical protein SAMN04488031_10319 [Roseovarius indicus]